MPLASQYTEILCFRRFLSACFNALANVFFLSQVPNLRQELELLSRPVFKQSSVSDASKTLGEKFLLQTPHAALDSRRFYPVFEVNGIIHARRFIARKHPNCASAYAFVHFDLSSMPAWSVVPSRRIITYSRLSCSPWFTPV
jgi:hypothetical protein